MMEVMNETRRLAWLRDEILSRWDKKALRTGLARDVPEVTPFTYNKKVCDLPPELIFMHEAIFASGERVEDITLEYKAPRMHDACQEVDLEEAKYRLSRQTGDRVEDYLKMSEEKE